MSDFTKLMDDISKSSEVESADAIPDFQTEVPGNGMFNVERDGDDLVITSYGPHPDPRKPWGCLALAQGSLQAWLQ